MGIRATETRGALSARMNPEQRRRLALSWVGAITLLVGLALTSALAVASYEVNQHSERRLLDLQVRQTASVLQAVVPAIETPLASAAEIAAITDGSAHAFRSFIDTYVGGTAPFASASLWRVDGASAQLVAAAGRTSVLAKTQARASRVLSRATQRKSLTVVGPLTPRAARPRLGYMYPAGTGAMYVVYAESLLPKNRYAEIPKGSPFADLDFALYLGKAAESATLLETNVDHLPVSGTTAKATVPFGGSALTLVARSKHQLGGSLSGSLWWIVIIAGCALTAAAVGTAERLSRGRRAAEVLTDRMGVLLSEQRSISSTLQRALLPERLHEMPGLAAEARYVAGVEDVEIGGDWYDLIPLDDQRVFFVIGDVSGRGLRAGATMAALRFAIRAFVSERNPPAAILDKLARMVDVGRDGQFATVLCGVLDIGAHTAEFANAGHLQPLLIGAGERRYLEVAVGTPIGVASDTPYRTVRVDVPPNAKLLGFTDGLIERPGESLDVGLDRLRSTVDSTASLPELLDGVVSELAHDSRDDIAILGVQWLA